MNRLRLFVALCVYTLAALVVPDATQAELKSLEIFERTPFAGGKSFGKVGPYERLVGIARFAIDPAHIRNYPIVDLDLAPRNAENLVEFSSDVFILAPKDLAKSSGSLLYDVNNRGGKLALRFFNRAKPTNDPTTVEDAGDGFLMNQGYVIVWSGWLGELLPGGGRMLMHAPVALDGGKPLKGMVRYEIMADEPTDTMPISRRENHGSFPLTERGLRDGLLTWRMRPGDARVLIPRAQWSLETMPIPPAPEYQSGKHGVGGSLPQIRMKLAGGFRPGYLYELIAECEGSLVQGVCYPAVRDLISFLRYDASPRNPLVGADGNSIVTHAHGFGVSQSGRYLRNFVYLGFNADEQDRKVFDGIMPHVAGAGLGYFNHRFCQPTRLNSQHLEHFYPSDYFPFTYNDETDPYSKRPDGILRLTRVKLAATMPKIMHTQGTGEYWHRAGSLVHTDPLGKVDAKVPDEVRIYTFGGTQHSATSLPLTRGTGENLLNPADYNPFLRALLVSLDKWTRDGTPPPPSVHPYIADGTLVDPTQHSTGFPAIPGVRFPEVIQVPERLEPDPQNEERQFVLLKSQSRGEKYVVKVPRVGPDGNELGTLLPPEVAVPTATYTGWNLRRAEVGAEGELVSLMGSYIPFPRTKAERVAKADPRVSLEERYGSFEFYRNQFGLVCDEYVRDGYLLAADAKRLVAELESIRDLFPSPTPADPKAATLAKASGAKELPTVASPKFVMTAELDAPEANQAAAVHGEQVFAISNITIATYDRRTGRRVATSPAEPKLKHLNSGFFDGSNLFCAHSNYPAEPAASEIYSFYRFDPPLAHVASLKAWKAFGKARGSLTWAVRDDEHWWCTFAQYGDKNGDTMLVEFDKDWDELGAWRYPPEVVADLGKASISGGLFYKGKLLATGHDRKVIYRLAVPKDKNVLELIDVVEAPFTGQGIAYDDKTGGLVGIDRARKKIVFAELRE